METLAKTRQTDDVADKAQNSRHKRPLSSDHLNQLFDRFSIPAKGRQRIQRVRDSLPARATKTGKLAGKLRYPSKKMGFVLEAEAFATEFVALVEWENDPDTLEVYAQPADGLYIEYESAKTGRPVGTHITPDAFRITTSGFIYTECKTEAELLKLSIEQPHRFTKADGHWRSPPAEVAARELGCQFEVRSDSKNNWVLLENLELLQDFFRTSLLVPDEAIAEIKRQLSGKPFVSAFDLIHVDPKINADHLYALLVRNEVYFPLSALRLTDQEQAFFFRSEVDWTAHKLFMQADDPERRRPKLRTDVRQGDAFTWNGVAYEVINVGTDTLVARSGGDKGPFTNIGYEQLDKLLASEKFVLHQAQDLADRSEADAILRRASKAELQEATWRHQILFSMPDTGNPLVSRKERIRFAWKRKYKEAQERWGNGFIGLIPFRSGNRVSKVSTLTKSAAVYTIKKYWESARCHTRIHSYARYLRLTKRLAVDALSYQSFCSEIKKRSGHAQTVTRIGEKAAYDLEPQFLELDRTTPRHGTHSWHIGHIDHTPLPLKFLLGDHFGLADTVWLTILTSAFDRKIRGYYLSFDEPSYRSCMMVIRDCVRRHGKFFQRVVSDGGSDFLSSYYETLLAAMDATKRERPRSKARFGSVCERIFRTTQTQFVTNLLGSTDIVEKHFRAVSPEVAPVTHAVWLLDAFDAAFEKYLGVYHSAHHSGLDMTPDEAEALSLRSHGHRTFKRFVYNDQFIAQTYPAVHRGDVLVQPEGVKIKYRWFSGPELRSPGVIGTRVPARYDPWNGGIAYVYVAHQWYKIHSQYHAVFSQLSERAIRFATDAMRLVASKRGERAIISAQALVRFMMTINGQEATARQQRNDAEAAAHRSKVQMPGPAMPVTVRPQGPGAQVITLPVPKRQRKIMGDL